MNTSHFLLLSGLLALLATLAFSSCLDPEGFRFRCDDDQDCLSGFTCDGDGVCQVEIGCTGDSCDAPECDESRPCSGGQECVAGTCVEPGSGGEDSCEGDEDCDEGVCDQRFSICVENCCNFQLSTISSGSTFSSPSRMTLGHDSAGRPVAAWVIPDSSTGQTRIYFAEATNTAHETWSVNEVALFQGQYNLASIELAMDSGDGVHLSVILTTSSTSSTSTWVYLVREEGFWNEHVVSSTGNLRFSAIEVDHSDSIHLAGFGGGTGESAGKVFYGIRSPGTGAHDWTLADFTMSKDGAPRSIFGADMAIDEEGEAHFSFLFSGESGGNDLYLGTISGDELTTTRIFQQVGQTPHQLLIDADGEKTILSINQDFNGLLLLSLESGFWGAETTLEDWDLQTAVLQVDAQGRSHLAFAGRPPGASFGTNYFGYYRWNGKAYQTHVDEELTSGALYADFVLTPEGQAHFLVYDHPAKELQYISP